VARLLLEAGAPRKAAGVFKELVRADPSDAQAFEGLGEAEFASGHYLSARTAFARSLALDSSRADVLESLRLCNRVVELDPTYRRAGTRERWRRSQRLLQRAIAELLVCSELPEPGALGPPQPLPEPAQRLLAEARAQVDAGVDPAKSEEAVESNISLAEGLWAARQATCPEITPRDEPLRHVLVRLAQ
jgi:tetratricopeptide (TPR) repeat protein